MSFTLSEAELPLKSGVAITLGNFDGVHVGHRMLIEQTQKIAAKENLDFALVTFWPHPRKILPSQITHQPLTTRAQRMSLLKTFGAHNIVEMDFTPELAAFSANDFIELHLLPLGLRHLVVGHDFSMGRGREGNINLLRQIGARNDFKVTQIPPVSVGGEIVSSTKLRDSLKKGEVTTAAKLLGRNYTISGHVGHGEARGRGMGFPTANLENCATLIPGNGVYATFAYAAGKRFGAVTNIGIKPTFNEKNRTVESFLLDADINLYGQEITLEFIAWLREEKRFSSPEALISQIRKDVETAAGVLARA